MWEVVGPLEGVRLALSVLALTGSFNCLTCPFTRTDHQLWGGCHMVSVIHLEQAVVGWSEGGVRERRTCLSE